MDIVSHGLWGGVTFGRRSRRSFLAAFLFGVAPDLIAFGPFFALSALGVISGPRFSSEPPDPLLIPHFVYATYSVTHSVFMFAATFGLLWIIFRRPVWESAGWGLHILFDIPTHSTKFFPTPFLWPVADTRVDGIPWNSPFIFIPNAVVLIALLFWLFVVRPRRTRREKPSHNSATIRI